MEKKFFLIFSSIFLVALVLPITFCISCSSNNKSTGNEETNDIIFEKLKNEYLPWYKSLTNKNWNKDNNGNYLDYFCSSEQQAIGLYSWNGGTFWNELLHRGWTLEDDKNNKQIFNIQLKNPPMDPKKSSFNSI